MKILIAVVLIILIVLFYREHAAFERELTGMWAATDAFCEKSNIESMLLYIGEPNGYLSKTRHGYLLIPGDVSNQEITLRYIKINPFSRSVSADIEFGSEELWPQNISITIDEMMKIYGDGVLLGELVRRPDLIAI